MVGTLKQSLKKKQKQKKKQSLENSNHSTPVGTEVKQIKSLVGVARVWKSPPNLCERVGK